MSLIFVKEALKKFKTQGSLLPSTSALSRRMLQPVKMLPGSIIVELGAGTGIFTKEIIRRLPIGAKLVTFENNKALACRLRADLSANIREGKVILIEDDAANFPLHLERINIPKAHFVVSGLPIGNFNHASRKRIFDAINKGMRDDGIFVQFQYLLASWLHVRKAFNAKIIGYEVKNFPPAFVYKCRKR